MLKRKQVISITFILVSIFILLVGCTELRPIVNGSGKLSTWNFDHRDFKKIEANSSFELNISRADSYLVRITFDDNLLEYLDIKKSGDTLFVGLKTNYSYVNCVHSANISLPDLSEVKLSGASGADIKGFGSSRSMRFNLSGASNAHIDDFKSGDTHFELSGASDITGSVKINSGTFSLSGASEITLSGSASDVSIDASGASHVNLEDFLVANTEVVLSGASDATINTNGRLDYDLSGASKLYTTGNPKLGDIKISGGSKIIKR